MSSPALSVPRWLGRRSVMLNLLPALALVLLVFVVPTIKLLTQSVSGDGVRGLSEYDELLHSSVVMQVLVRTVITSLGVTLVSLFFAYPYAYIMATTGRRLRGIMLAVVIFSFWTPVMTRTFAWIVLLERDGPVDHALEAVGLHGVSLLHNLTGAYIGMVQVMMPYFVLLLYSSMRSIDDRLMVAASTLGATRRRAFLHVYLPLTASGIESGITLVYILALGFYLTPAVLGSPQNALMAQFIDTEISQQLDFAQAGALSTLLIAAAIVGFIVIKLLSTWVRRLAGIRA